jgi:hypothetical protein
VRGDVEKFGWVLFTERLLRRPGHRWDDDIEMDPREVG